MIPNSVRKLFGFEPLYGGQARSSEWPRLRAAFLKANPKCAACGRAESVVPHHIKPYHKFPELELVWDNLVSMCEWKTMNCHLWLAHGGRWDWWNPSVVDDAWWFSKVLSSVRNAETQ